MFFRGYESKNGPKCARGFASTLYTPSVRGSAHRREQKVAKMLPWSWFLGSTGAKTALNAPVGLHDPRYTAPVAGAAIARSQKQAKT